MGNRGLHSWATHCILSCCYLPDTFCHSLCTFNSRELPVQAMDIIELKVFWELNFCKATVKFAALWGELTPHFWLPNSACFCPMDMGFCGKKWGKSFLIEAEKSPVTLENYNSQNTLKSMTQNARLSDLFHIQIMWSGVVEAVS